MGRKSMLLDLSSLVGRIGAVEEFEIPDSTIVEEGFTAHLYEIRVRATNCGASIQIEGSFAGRVPLECSRCLTQFEHRIAERIEESIPIRFGGADAEEIEAADEYDITILSGSRMDVIELVRQQILTALPMIPVCSEACEGLCASCGEPKATCSCEERGEGEPKTELGRLLANAFKTDGEGTDTDEP
jgi:uncharacterized protein